jgi:hypothetical protein
MLSEFQIKKTWENMLAAESLSLYFADLARSYTRQKQWITGFSFFLSSGAAATIIAKAPALVPIILSLIVAASTAYAMAVNLDGKISTMSKLHSAWASINAAYEHLWNHTYDDDAESQLEKIIAMEAEPSELATTEAPNDQKLLDTWQQRVFSLNGLVDTHATTKSN